MTVVVLWLEPEEHGDALWAAADTRFLLGERSGGTFIRTNAASKILGLPVRVHTDMFRRPFHEGVLGFAFAGDATPALSTYGLASTFLQNLLSVDQHGLGVGRPPEFHEIAWHCGRLASRFVNETLESTNGRMGKFDAVVFGWCPIAEAYKAYALRPGCSLPVTFSVESIDLRVGNPPFVLGNTEAYLQSLAKLQSEGDPHGRTMRTPMLALEALIDSGQASDVGGGVSLARVAPRGQLQLFSRMRPVQPGEPAAKLYFNGYSLDGNDAWVGHCMVAMLGMA